MGMLAITCLGRMAGTAKIVGTNLKGGAFERVVYACRSHLVCIQVR